MVNVDKKGQLKVLFRERAVDRATRRRPDQNHKAEALFILQEKDNQDFAKRWGDYGYTWAERVKGDEDAMPSLQEVFEGVEVWFIA